MHQQTKLIDDLEEAAEQVEAFLQKVLDQGGEGVVVRNPQATWTPKRHRGILKYKPFSTPRRRSSASHPGGRRPRAASIWARLVL